MARGRFISESVAKDARLNSLSVEAQLVYLMTVPHLDRDGLIEGDPDVLWGTVCPKRRQFLDRMAEFIQEWAKAGLVLMYDTEDGPVLWFKGFAKNQTGMRYDREAPSKFSPPPSNDALPVCEPTPDKLPTNSGISTAQVQVEVEVKDQVEVQEKEAAPPALPELPAKQPTPQQELFGAICEAIGWDYHIISDKNKGQVAQTAKILATNNYTVEDIRRFMVEIWFKDWRWEKSRSHPTLAQLREEIGKLRSLVPAAAPPPKAKSLDSYRRLKANLGATA